MYPHMGAAVNMTSPQSFLVLQAPNKKSIEPDITPLSLSFLGTQQNTARDEKEYTPCRVFPVLLEARAEASQSAFGAETVQFGEPKHPQDASLERTVSLCHLVDSRKKYRQQAWEYSTREGTFCIKKILLLCKKQLSFCCFQT